MWSSVDGLGWVMLRLDSRVTSLPSYGHHPAVRLVNFVIDKVTRLQAAGPHMRVPRW